MATNIYANITARGTQAAFQEAMATVPQIWPQFCQTVSSDAPDEDYVWLGRIPDPREYIHGRNYVGIRDFTYNVVNQEHELSFIIDQTSMEDDRHGLCNRRVAEAAKVWVEYHDVLFAAACNNGASTGYNSFDGVSFFNDSHVIGAATPDNSLYDSSITTAASPTLAEMQSLIRQMKLALQGFQDDTGRENYNNAALTKVLLMGNQNYEYRMREAISSALIGGGNSNPYFENMADIIVNPYLTTSNDYLFMMAVGDPNRMPFIYQQRTTLQVHIYNSADDIAENHGLKVLCRDRFRLAYGEPRHAVLMSIA